MQLAVYDGADTIGGNKILLEGEGVNHIIPVQTGGSA
jgi:hypothetical protein